MKATSKGAPRVQVAVLCWLSLLIFGIATSFAQDAGQKTSQSFKSDILSRMTGKTSGTDGLGLTAYEGVIDRDSYRVGPGDKLMLQVWSPAYEETPTVVSGDGRVAVPFAGPVDVAGLTLAEAESAIATEFLNALKRGRVSISLIEPRKIRIPCYRSGCSSRYSGAPCDGTRCRRDSNVRWYPFCTRVLRRRFCHGAIGLITTDRDA